MSWFRALILAVLWTLPAGLTLPATQALVVRWAAPTMTLTMIESTLHYGTLPQAEWQSHAAMGPHPSRAAVTSEDARFFVHRGFDWDSICLALEHNQKGGTLRGGSTISQQTARNVFLWQRRSWVRKGIEAYYTLWLELLVPKERILELYLNVAETGPNVFGYPAAAQHWYGKPIHRLSPDEVARITTLLPNPKERRPTSKEAADKARRITKFPAPMPGDSRLADMKARWRARPWWPVCE